MILNFIWTIAISSVFPMLILLGMILGIEFANQLYYDNNSRTFDFCLRIIMYLIAFVLMVGFWALFINEFMTVEMKEAFPNFPMNFFIILSSLIVCGTICCILYRIQEKYQIKMKKLLAKIRNHYIKYAMIFFATSKRPSAVGGMPFSSKVKAITTPPYFFTSGNTSCMECSFPFTELINGFPL